MILFMLNWYLPITHKQSNTTLEKPLYNYIEDRSFCPPKGGGVVGFYGYAYSW